MKLKGKLVYRESLINVLRSIVLISCFILHGCQSEEFEVNPEPLFLKINGDLNHPETLMDPVNIAIYLKAVERMETYLMIRQNKIECGIKEGSEVNISPEIYNYIIMSYEDINKQVDEGRIKIFFDSNGDLKVSKRVLDNGIIRLKSGDIEVGPDGKIDISNMDPEDIVALFLSLVANPPNDHLGNVIDLENIDWDINMGMASMSGEVYINGKRTVYQINDPCYSNPDPYCTAGYIATNDTDVYGDYAYYTVKNPWQLPLISVQVFE